jgi:hypothetical protein
MKDKAVPAGKQWLVCERLRALGYRSAKTIRLYGEEIHLLSDPAPHENGFAVEGITVRSSIVKRVRIPLSVVTMVEREIAAREKLTVAA